MALHTTSPSTSPRTGSAPRRTRRAHLVATEPCAQCREVQRRLIEIEAANAALRRDNEVAAQRLRLVMGQLASAEERVGHDALAGAIRSVAAGQTHLSFDAQWALLGEHAAVHPAAAAGHLGGRECQVLRLITEGHRTPSIAARLGIRASTVEVHRRNIMRKLGLHTVAALTKYALREGLTSL
jgi:DNA-binding NarL/FixJ family response regulator